MSTDDDRSLRDLHDKATRGGTLSPDERARLDEWYARNDSAEAAQVLNAPARQASASLQAQVDQGLAQLLSVTQRIQAVEAANEALRREVAALQQRLSRTPPKAPAQPA